MRKIILVALALMVAGAAYSQTTQAVRGSWTPPTEGSPAVSYIFQLSTDGGPFVDYATTDTTFVDMNLEIFKTYIARVAALDDQGRQGPWSEDSDPYFADLGPPGAPSKPMVVEN